MDSASVERRLAAIIAMDVVGYSRLMGIDEVGTLGALKVHRAELIDPAVAAHHGRLVKTTGDGLLLEFASVVDAIGCAVAVQRGMLSRNTPVPEDRRIVFRIGVNIGDIIIEGSDIFGDGVNVAARLETLCEPGGIAISRAANEQVRDKLSLSFADLGEHMVKNIARAVGVFGLAAAEIAQLPEIAVYRTEAPPQAARRRGRVVAAAVAAVAVLSAAAAGWWLTREPPAATQSFEPRLAAALAQVSPAAPVKNREDTAAAFARAPAHRALAVAPRTAKTWWTKGWGGPEQAEEKALEKCQQVYDEPCAVVALDDSVLPAGPDGSRPVRDAARVHYTGPFNPERIPAMRQNDLLRPEVVGYATATGAKAVAFHANGVLQVVTGAASQRAAEEQALKACAADPLRQETGGVCYLYAAGNRVVLTLRLTAPLTPLAVASPPAPAAVAPASLAEVMTKLAPELSATARNRQLAGYQEAKLHKALAVHPPGSSWRSSGWDSAVVAEERTLEGCQARHGEPCVLVAVDDAVRAPPATGGAPSRPMPRALYAGLFDPQQIPAGNEALRQRPDVLGYRAKSGPKAAAYHPWGRLFPVTDAANQRTAEEQALQACNADPQRGGDGGPCLLYAAGDQVVLAQHATGPVTAAK